MSRIHSTLIALVVAAAAAAGLVAAVQTVRLGQSAPAARPATVPAHEIALREAKLARWGNSLHRALAKRPPALPKVPHYKPVAIPAAPSAPIAATQPAASASGVTYVRPPTVVKYKRRPASPTTTTTGGWQDDGGDGSGSGGDDGGGDG
jgi:uncharacterized membrane protein YgcG